MVILNQGLNRIRDLTYDDLDNGQAGTDSTPAQDDQTALGSAIADTDNALTLVKSDKIIKATHRINATQAVGENITEWVIKMNSSAATRAVTNTITKDGNHIIDHIHTLFFNQY